MAIHDSSKHLWNTPLKTRVKQLLAYSFTLQPCERVVALMKHISVQSLGISHSSCPWISLCYAPRGCKALILQITCVLSSFTNQAQVQEDTLNFQKEQPVEDGLHAWLCISQQTLEPGKNRFKYLLDATRAFSALWKKQVRVHRGGLSETTSFITHFSWSRRLLSLIHPSQEKHLGWRL